MLKFKELAKLGNLMAMKMNVYEICISLLYNEVWYCPTILQEILQGTRLDRDFHDTTDGFKGLIRLDPDPYQVSFEAAQLYRSLRKEGLAIRKPNDCLIAFYALHFDIELCHNDRDFDLYMDHSG